MHHTRTESVRRVAKKKKKLLNWTMVTKGRILEAYNMGSVWDNWGAVHERSLEQLHFVDPHYV